MPKPFKITVSISVLLLVLFGGATFSMAATVAELQHQSASLSDQIKKLDAEILSINKQLNSTKQEKKTLSGELQKIETTRKSLLAQLTLTSKKIEQANATLTKLQGDINVKNQDIRQNYISLAEDFRQLRKAESNDILEIVLSEDKLSDLISQTENLDKLQANLSTLIDNLRQNKQTLETQKTVQETTKKNLTSLKTQLSGQKIVVEENKKEKDQLLQQTQNKESNYQKLLNDRLAKKKEVEAEMASLEAQIQIAVDTNALPKTGTSALLWPTVKVIITQYFGNTAFATKNAQLYNGKGHNGIDLGIPVGTNILAANSGKVMGVGNTDQTCKGASYGKWVLIQHNNGLSTLYAHLSAILVAEGQTVSAGQTIALSGNTGYSTGPHLHFTVYASQAVKVSSMQSKVAGCGVYRLPLASYNGYLNPLSYLPPKP